MAKKQQMKKDKEPGALFIPAGLFIGMGLGFLYNQLLAGMFLGLGAGFVLFGIASVIERMKKR